MCNPLAVVMAVTAVASYAQSDAQARKQEKQADKQQREVDKQARIQNSQRGSASGGLTDVSEENQGGSDLGLGNTFLTGSQGVGNDKLNLGGGASNTNNTLG